MFAFAAVCFLSPREGRSTIADISSPKHVPTGVPSPDVKWKEPAVLGFYPGTPLPDTELCTQFHRYAMLQFTVYIWEIKAITQNKTAGIKNNKSSIRIQGQVPHTRAHFQAILSIGIRIGRTFLHESQDYKFLFVDFF